MIISPTGPSRDAVAEEEEEDGDFFFLSFFLFFLGTSPSSFSLLFLLLPEYRGHGLEGATITALPSASATASAAESCAAGTPGIH
jgi:hypothetical protein